jgi:hypothetical protein
MHLFVHLTQCTIKYLSFNPLLKTGKYTHHMLQHPKLDTLSPYAIFTYIIRMVLMKNIGIALYYTNSVLSL